VLIHEHNPIPLILLTIKLQQISDLEWYWNSVCYFGVFGFEIEPSIFWFRFKQEWNQWIKNVVKGFLGFVSKKSGTHECWKWIDECWKSIEESLEHVNKNLASNSCGGINEKKTKVISAGQIHLFCWGGRWKLVARWRRGEEGVVWIQICLGEVVVCVSVTCSSLFLFFLISLIIRVELTILKINKNQKIYKWHDT